MTKRMDRNTVLIAAFDDMLSEVLAHYGLAREQRVLMVGAAIAVNDWENLTPAIPVVTWEVAGHKESVICLELMGRNRAPIEALGKKIAVKCYYWAVGLDPE